MHIGNFRVYSDFKREYLTHDREPFYKIAMQYGRLVQKETPVIADIGSGEGDFYTYLKNNNFPVDKVYLLDSNSKTTENNQSGITKNSVYYTAPERLPFNDQSVDLVHVSHLMGVLTPSEIYALMLEMHRVIAADGYLVISAPMFWSDFYDDLGHVRPYNPRVFYKYFVEMYRNNRLEKVSDNYEMVKLAYRYHQAPLDEGWGSSIPAIDYLMITVKRVLGKLGLRKLYKNGYTIVLKKKQSNAHR